MNRASNKAKVAPAFLFTPGRAPVLAGWYRRKRRIGKNACAA